MKILHTSDWHIGKRLGAVYRLQEQEKVLAEICEIANEQAVDAVIIAGDLFDTFNPPIDALELFYATVKKLSNNGTRPVIAIAGNHDSPDRIEAPNPLARDNGVFLFGYPKSEYSVYTNDLPFSITKVDKGFIELTLQDNQKLRIILAPFANEFRMKEAFIENETSSIVESLNTFWNHIANTYCDSKGVNILVGHHLMLASQTDEIIEPDDEKPIQAISALLPTSIIPPHIQYVALGHLHQQQIISHSPFVTYSGSPCAYSFSEAMQKKSISIVTVFPNKPAQLETIELANARMLIRKKCESIQDALDWLAAHQNCYVELTIIHDSYFTPAEIKSLHAAHSGIIYIIPEIHNVEELEQSQQMPSRSASIDELFVSYFEHKHGQKPNKELLTLFSEIRGESL